MEISEYVKNNVRYCTFTFLDEPVWFDEYFKDTDFDRVQIHDMTKIKPDRDEIFGFVGSFEFKDNIIESLDGDSYTSHMQIYGYEKFFDEEDGDAIDILVFKW